LAVPGEDSHTTGRTNGHLCVLHLLFRSLNELDPRNVRFDAVVLFEFVGAADRTPMDVRAAVPQPPFM